MTKEKLAKLRGMGLVFDEVFDEMAKNRDEFNEDWAKKKKEQEKLKVLQIEGPFYNSDFKPSFVSKERQYYYLASLNQKVTQENIKEIKWAVSYDSDGVDKTFYLFSGGKIQNGKVRVDIQISKGDSGFKIYAYTDKISSRNGYVECFYKKVIVFFIGGAGDKEKFAGQGPSGIMKDVNKDFDKIYGNNKQYITNYLGYNEVYGEDRINNNVIPSISNKEGTEVFIVGHSLGGWNGAHLSKKLKQKGYSVELLITLDPVGVRGGTQDVADIYRGYPMPLTRFWINIYTNPAKNEIDDYVAGLGGQWKPNNNNLTFFLESQLHHGEASGMLNEFIKNAGASAYTFLVNQISYYLFLP